MMLVITKAGLGALDGEPTRESGKQPTPSARTKKPRTVQKPAAPKSKSKHSPPAVRQGTKQALLIDLLKRKTGASIDEIVEATGWQAHSVRGAISGSLKKRLGLPVTSENVENRGRVYRIAEPG